jgi:prevent-host-death family protein
MNKRVSVAEAKNNIPAIIHEVEKGSIVEITRYGRAVAFVVPQKDYERLQEKGGGFWEALIRFRNILNAEGIDMKDRDFSNLRDFSPGRPVDLE